ncbi:MAG: amidohydrolase family protein [Planctomycetes bacterium]|nr:amidohydrolase family protein [Planctomycetota bacterium]
MQNIHAHVWDQALHFTGAVVREAALSRGRPMDLTVTAEALLAEAAAFDRTIIFGLKARRTGYWVPDDYVARQVALAPDRLIGFASADPTQPHCMDELTHAIEDLHLRGVKMGPMYAGFDPRDACCRDVYAYCQARGLPILFHTGTTFNRLAPLRFTRPMLWDEVAMDWPDLPMVLAHLGHPFHEECICVIRKHPNVYADVAALHYRPWQFYTMLLTAQEYRVMHKLLVGTDYPFAGAAETLAGLRAVNGVTGSSGLPRVDPEAVEALIARDALALLGIAP